MSLERGGRGPFSLAELILPQIRAWIVVHRWEIERRTLVLRGESMGYQTSLRSLSCRHSGCISDAGAKSIHSP